MAVPNDVFLYAGEANPNDILLSDPTVLRGAAAFFGILKRWTGATWTRETLQTYNGATFVTKSLKRWTGTEWGTVDTNG